MDLTGQRFGALTAKEIVGRTKCGNVIWLCICDCGNPHRASAGSLRGGKVTSCGCTKPIKISAARTTHGDSRSTKPRAPEYIVWCQVKGRCTNKKNPAYKDYGGRGITVCKRWYSYENFLADMGRRPSPKHSIERKKNHLGYAPGNCVWATREIQANNKRNNHRLEYAGTVTTLSTLARLRGLKPSTLRARLKRGLALEQALQSIG